MFHFRQRSVNKPSPVKVTHPPKARDDVSMPVPANRDSSTSPDVNQQENVPPAVFRHRRTASDQEQLTRARAMELCTMYELSDDRDTSLKKLAIPETKRMLSLSESLAASQAAVLYAQRRQKENTKKKKINKKTNKRMPLNETPITDSLRFAVPLSSNPGKNMKRGFKVDIPTSPSETSTLAETPSPVTEDLQSKAGRHYNFGLPNMC